MAWKHVITSTDGDCTLFGVNIFNYDWTNTGKKIRVKDPEYHYNYMFTIWKVKIKDIDYAFAAGEFSANVWGFYLFYK